MSPAIFAASARSKSIVIDLMREFRAASASVDLYDAVKTLGSHAYMSHRDKGQDRSIWHHVEEVKERVKSLYNGRVSPQRLMRLKALAIMHDILELKDAAGRRIWNGKDLIDAGLPHDFVADVEALTKRPNEPYLDYVRRLAQSPDAVLVKLADLEENMRPDRGKVNASDTDQVFRDKKAFLYPVAHAYLNAVALGQVKPEETSVRAFIMQNPYLPGHLKDEDRLSTYSTDTQSYNARRARPVAAWLRGVACRAVTLGRPAALMI